MMTHVSLADLKRQVSEFRFLVIDQNDCRRHTPPERPIISLDDLIVKGEKIERLFGETQTALGSDVSYVAERREFFCAFADLFYDLLDYSAIREGDPAHCLYAHKACEYYTKSSHPRGAIGLAYIFQSLGFYATAI